MVTVEAHNAAVGKTIKGARVENDRLLLIFEDSALALYDDKQNCCEHRYMHTDDDLSAFAGSIFQGAELRDAPSTETDWCGVHEIQFLLINTSLGTFTIETHNEHNGYYGGFRIIARTEEVPAVDPGSPCSQPPAAGSAPGTGLSESPERS